MKQASSNPFGFGIVDDTASAHEKKRDKKAQAKAEEKVAEKKTEKPKFSGSSKLGKKVPDTSKIDPEVVEPKPQKYQKKDRSSFGFGLLAKNPEKAKPSNSFFGLFGGKNPFLKPSKVSKTLIATPSKFEIRHESPKKPVGRPPKAAGIRDKLKPKAARPVGRPVGSTKPAKMSVKSKNIQKAKDLLKKKLKEKKE